jgi:hypothetical protein
MKVVCALCEREGKAAYLGERAPYDNPATTHGICSLALGIEKDSRRARRLTILNAISGSG